MEDKSQLEGTAHIVAAEKWKWISGYEGRYEVSDLGRVRSWVAHTGNTGGTRSEPYLRKLIPNSDDGYLEVMLVKPGTKNVMKKVHVIVLETFVGPRPVNQVARHVNDRNLLDNRLNNLAWGTNEDNADDSIRHGTDTRGEKNTEAKLTQSMADEIRIRRRRGERGCDLALEFGVSQCTISNVKTNKTYVK